MTITIHLWMLLLGGTVAAWCITTCWPYRDRGFGSYIGAAVDALVRFVCLTVGTLLVWLIFFAAKAAQII